MGLFHSKPSYSVLVAIDFGTTFSGYAYSLNKGRIQLNENWGAQIGGQFWKTPTSVLYREDGRTVDFGFIAEETYFNKKEGLLFKDFKMQLYRKENYSHSIGRNMTVKSLCGTEKSALDVFGDALKYMKDCALKNIEKEAGIRSEDFRELRWVVTVPAIWNDSQKMFMREACLKAKLIDERHSKNLIIALEAEGASKYCRDLPCYGFILPKEIYTKPELKTGTTFMTVDLGGGTVDITVHKVEGDTVKEVIPATGGPFGGNTVNKSFAGLLARWLGKDFIDHVQKKRPNVWWELIRRFENSKRSLDDANKDIVLTISLGFAQCYEAYFKRNIRDVANGEGIRISDDSNILLSENTTKSLFKEALDGIKKKMTDALKEAMGKVQYIFLVGGFSESKFVQKELNLFSQSHCDGIRIFCPNEASLCVLKGAVMYGNSPNYIKSRVSSLTHALLSEPQNDGGYLDVLIRKGEDIPVGTMRSRKVKIPKSLKSVEKAIFTSNKKKIDRKGPDTKRLDILLVEIPENAREDTYIELQFIFGTTEFHVRAADGSNATVSICGITETERDADFALETGPRGWWPFM